MEGWSCQVRIGIKEGVSGVGLGTFYAVVVMGEKEGCVLSMEGMFDRD
ncbi:uncharacterized protein An02g09870 [Aspergillus niger]|uniref:Contig An02c0300, genomic contig n=2 Tax=Aspergillus niger TaxID=5061 RepID=A2QE94_ASPNC|nr:uncharacterized protein An02g09870 [Aspergillus niger]CAK37855.1 unnamed protein product [Aspergillus niger]